MENDPLYGVPFSMSKGELYESTKSFCYVKGCENLEDI